jgi:hypothetical protein
MLDAGQGPGSKAAQYLYRLSTTPFMRRTQIHGVGVVQDTAAVDDFDAATPVTTAYISTAIAAGSTWYDVQTAYIQHRDTFQAPQTTATLTRTGIRLRALVALVLAPSAIKPNGKVFGAQEIALGNRSDLRSFDVGFRMTLGTEAGADVTTGTETVYRMTPVGHNSGPDVDSAIINHFAALVDMQRAISNGVTGYKGSAAKTHAHTLYGAMPESAWADSVMTFVDITIADATAGQRLMTMQASIDGVSISGTRVHVMAMLISDLEATMESEVGGV